jgi:hypothetical protein
LLLPIDSNHGELQMSTTRGTEPQRGGPTDQPTTKASSTDEIARAEAKLAERMALVDAPAGRLKTMGAPGPGETTTSMEGKPREDESAGQQTGGGEAKQGGVYPNIGSSESASDASQAERTQESRSKQDEGEGQSAGGEQGNEDAADALEPRSPSDVQRVALPVGTAPIPAAGEATGQASLADRLLSE